MFSLALLYRSTQGVYELWGHRHRCLCCIVCHALSCFSFLNVLSLKPWQQSQFVGLKRVVIGPISIKRHFVCQVFVSATCTVGAALQLSCLAFSASQIAWRRGRAGSNNKRSLKTHLKPFWSQELTAFRLQSIQMQFSFIWTQNPGREPGPPRLPARALN